MESVGIFFLCIGATFIATFAGFGLSTIMIPLLLIWLPLEATLLLVGILHFSHNILKLILFRISYVRKDIVLYFGIPAIIMAIIGAHIVTWLPRTIVVRVLGIILFGEIVYLIINPSFHVPRTRTVLGTGGILTGLSAGISGISGSLRSATLILFDLPKEAFITTSAVLASVIDISRLVTYLSQGMRVSRTTTYLLPVFIIGSAIGAYAAKHIIDRVPRAVFRRIVLGFVLLAALKLVFIP